MVNKSLEIAAETAFLLLDQQDPKFCKVPWKGFAVEVNLKKMPEEKIKEALLLKKLFYSTQPGSFSMHKEMVEELRQMGIREIDIHYLDGRVVVVKRDAFSAVEEETYSHAFSSLRRESLQRRSTDQEIVPNFFAVKLEAPLFTQPTSDKFLEAVAKGFGRIIQRVVELFREQREYERLRAQETNKRELQKSETLKEQRAAARVIVSAITYADASREVALIA